MTLRAEMERRLRYDCAEEEALEHELVRASDSSISDRIFRGLLDIEDNHDHARLDLQRAREALHQADQALQQNHLTEAYLLLTRAENEMSQAERLSSVFSRRTSARALGNARNLGVVSWALTSTGAVGLAGELGVGYSLTAGFVGGSILQSMVDDGSSASFRPRSTLSLQPLHDRAQSRLVSPRENLPGTDVLDFMLETELQGPHELLTPRDVSNIHLLSRQLVQELRNLQRNPKNSDMEFLMELAQTIFDRLGMANYQRDRHNIIDLLTGRGGACGAETRAMAAYLLASGRIPKGWEVTLQRFDATANDDGHVQVILYHAKDHRFLNPVSGEYTQETNSPLFPVSALDAAYLLSNGREPLRVYEDPAMIIYRPPHWTPPVSGMTPRRVTDHPPFSPPHALRFLPLTGVSLGQGHAPQSAVLPAPALHNVGEAITEKPVTRTMNSQGMLPTGRIFREGQSPNTYLDRVMRAGLPFFINPDRSEVVFSSHRHLRFYNNNEDPNQSLKNITQEMWSRPEWEQTLRRTQHLLQNPADFSFESPEDIARVNLLLSWSQHHFEIKNFLPSYPGFIEAQDSFASSVSAHPENFLRILDHQPAAMRAQMAQFLYLSTLGVGRLSNSSIYSYVFTRALSAQYLPQDSTVSSRPAPESSDSGRNNSSRVPRPGGSFRVLVRPSSGAITPQPLQMAPETFYSLLLGMHNPLRAGNTNNFPFYAYSNSPNNTVRPTHDLLVRLAGSRSANWGPILRQNARFFFTDPAQRSAYERAIRQNVSTSPDPAVQEVLDIIESTIAEMNTVP